MKKIISVNLESETLSFIKERARSGYMSVSAYVRKLIDKDREKAMLESKNEKSEL